MNIKNPTFSLFIGILCIGLYPILVKTVNVHGVSAAFYRMFLACVFLFPALFFFKKLKPIPKKWIGMLALSGFLFAADIAVWNISIQVSSATQATLLTNLAPIWVGIGSFLFLAKKPNRWFWLGAIVALSGMSTLVGFDVIASLQLDLGFWFAVLSGVFYATYMLVSKSIMRQMDVLNFMAYSMLFSTALLLLTCITFDFPLSHFTFPDWFSLFILALICQLLGWISISYAVQKLEASSVSLTLLSQAVVTGLLAWLFIGEKMTLQMILGGIIILIGIGITYLPETKRT